MGPNGHIFQCHRDQNLPWKFRIVEDISIAQTFMRNELEIFTAESVTVLVVKFVNDIL